MSEQAVAPRTRASWWPNGKAALGHPAFLELLRWCLPALLVGLALRATVMVSMPYAFIQYDSSDFFETTFRLIEKHEFYVQYRRSYLTPYLFSLPCLLPWPALITIAVMQHAMGLLATILVGSLIRLWFCWWKVAIIPITLLFAASPMVIWYEHVVLGETQYLFFALLAVLAGTLFVRRPGWPMFATFMISLFLVMGTRLEAKTFCLFGGVLIVCVFWRQWRRLAIGLTMLVGVMFLALRLGPGRDGSSLTYATLIRFAPDQSKSEPDIAPFLLPLRDAMRARFPDYPGDLVQLDKDVTKMVHDYVHAQKARHKKEDRSRVLKNLCREAIAARPVESLLLPLQKFRLAIDVWSAYAYDADALVNKQRHSATHRPWMLKLSKRLTGQKCDRKQMIAWVDSHYDADRIAWLGRYQEMWNNARIAIRTPDRPLTQERWVHDFYGGVPNKRQTMPGLPYFYLLALLGMTVTFFRPARFQWVHIAWIATILGGLYVASLIGVTNARYRFTCEIFFVLYFALLIETLAHWLLARRGGSEESLTRS
jgi:hypothetical protein